MIGSRIVHTNTIDHLILEQKITICCNFMTLQHKNSVHQSVCVVGCKHCTTTTTRKEKGFKCSTSFWGCWQNRRRDLRQRWVPRSKTRIHRTWSHQDARSSHRMTPTYSPSPPPPYKHLHMHIAGVRNHALIFTVSILRNRFNRTNLIELEDVLERCKTCECRRTL